MYNLINTKINIQLARLLYAETPIREESSVRSLFSVAVVSKMILRCALITLLFQLILPNNGHANATVKKGNIVLFHTVGTRSHLIVMRALMEGLAQDGHNVTAITFSKPADLGLPNYRELQVQDR